MPTAVAHPCSDESLLGAVEAAKQELITPILFGPEDELHKIADAQKVDLSRYRIVATADAEDSAAKAAAMAMRPRGDSASLRSSPYVGQVGRHSPHCTH